jgi:hypothetical protein
MTYPEIAWYLARLALIPSSPVTATGVLDFAHGTAECRRIGYEISHLHGREGMDEVCRAYRDSVDAETAAKIAQAWGGIGQWPG